MLLCLFENRILEFLGTGGDQTTVDRHFEHVADNFAIIIHDLPPSFAGGRANRQPLSCGPTTDRPPQFKPLPPPTLPPAQPLL